MKASQHMQPNLLSEACNFSTKLSSTISLSKGLVVVTSPEVRLMVKYPPLFPERIL